MKIFDKLIVIFLVCIYLLVAIGCLKELGEGYFSWPHQLGIVEWISLIIFCFTFYLGMLKEKYFSFLLIFFLVGFPVSFNNILPSVLISNTTNYFKTFYPLITHIDIFLLAGLCRFYKKKTTSNFFLRGIKILTTIIFIITIYSLISNDSNHEKLIILSHSYHFRYLALLVLIASYTSVFFNHRYLFFGFLFSIGFLVLESILTFKFNYGVSSRYRSGSLGNNTFGSFLATAFVFLTHYYRKYNKAFFYWLGSVFLVFLIFLTQTRIAIFITLLCLTYNLLKILSNNLKLNLVFLAILSLVFFKYILVNKIPERYDITNLKLKKIDFSKNELNDILVLEDNKFNASLKLRFNHFQTSLNMIQQNPIFGIGSGTWDLKKTYYGSHDKNYMDSHNDFLGVMSQYGIIIGIILCVFMYFFPSMVFLKSKKEHLQSFYVFSLTMSIMGLTNTNLFKFPIYSFLAFICVYYANNYQKKLNENRYNWN